MDTKQLMTEDIDRMEAGPEMDALVAERVMGWYVDRFIYRGLERDQNRQCEVWVTDPARATDPPSKRIDVTKNPIPFSTDIAAAWQVVKAVATDMRNFHMVHYAYNRAYATFAFNNVWDDDLLIGEGNGEHADCEAICKAALKATILQKD